MAKKQMYLLDFFLIWLTVLPFSLCKGGDAWVSTLLGSNHSLVLGYWFVVLVVFADEEAGGVTKRYPLTDDGSVLFPMLYGYYRRVSRR